MGWEERIGGGVMMKGGWKQQFVEEHACGHGMPTVTASVCRQRTTEEEHQRSSNAEHKGSQGVLCPSFVCLTCPTKSLVTSSSISSPSADTSLRSDRVSPSSPLAAPFCPPSVRLIPLRPFTSSSAPLPFDPGDDEENVEED